MAEQKQQFPRIDFVTPVGRLVAGSLAEYSTRGYQGQVRDKAQAFFGLAIPKSDPGIPALFQMIHQHAAASYGFAQNIQQLLGSFRIGAQVPPGYRAPFAWKIDDGDSPDEVQKEGRAGCWILKFATTQPFQVVDSARRQLDPKTVDLGNWAQVSGNCSINGKVDGTAGVFLNPRFVMIVGSGAVINPGPTVEQAFAGVQTVLPPGVQPYTGAPAAAMPSTGQPQQQAAAYGYQQTVLPAGAPASAYAYQPPAAAPANAYQPPAPAPQAMPADQWAAMHQVQHIPGLRFNPTTRGYDPDVNPTPAPTAAPQTANPAMGQYQQPSVSYPPAAGQPATPTQPAGGAHGAYPSSEQIAAMHNRPHIPGLRFNPATGGYDPEGNPPAGAPAVPAGATAGPALYTAPNGSPATAYPSSAPVNYPAGVQPHYAFVAGPQGQR